MTPAVTYHRLSAANAHLLEGSAAFDNPIRPAECARFVADPGHELVFALSDGGVAGFASGVILLHPDKAPGFFVNEVGVSEQFRRLGIAKELCRQLFAIARERGCKGIWLGTEDDNTAARALYRSLEGRETAGVVVYDWDGAMDP